MDFANIAAEISKNPLLGLGLMMAGFAFMAWAMGRMGTSSATNLTNALAYVGTTSTALNQRSDQVITLERERGSLVAERDHYKRERDDLRLDLDILRSEVERLKLDAKSNVEAFTRKLEELQGRLNEVQLQLDTALKLNVEQQNTIEAKQNVIDNLQLELDTLREKVAAKNNPGSNLKI